MNNGLAHEEPTKHWGKGDTYYIILIFAYFGIKWGDYLGNQPII